MKLQLIDPDENYTVETFNISDDYDLSNENDIEILKKNILDTIENYIEENM
jgi:hypothetical protein